MRLNPPPPPPRPLSAQMRLMTWLSRLLLALLWLWGAEILFWNAPQNRSALDWAMLTLAYLLVTSVVLDGLARYRARDIWGVLLVLGVFGILNGILINPTTTYAYLPRRILSHSLGGQWFIGLEMFGLWLWLQRWRGDDAPWRRVRWALMVAMVMGFFWGVWVRWYAVYNPGDYIQPDFMTMLGVGAVGFAPPVIVWLLWRMLQVRPTIGADGVPVIEDAERAYLLDQREGALIAIGIIGLMMMHLIAGNYTTTTGILISGAILGVFWVVLWARDHTRKPSMLIELMPARPLPVPVLMFMGAVMVGMAWLGWHLPLVDVARLLPFVALEINQFTLLTTVFSAMGAFWIPVTAAAIGIETFSRQVQTGRI